MTGDQSVYLLFLVTLGKIIIVSTEKKMFVPVCPSGLITKLDAERAVPVKVDASWFESCRGPGGIAFGR